MRIEFGPFSFNTGTRLLKRGHAVIPLSPKAFDALHLLIRHRPDVVEKRTLLETVWQGTVVTDASVTVAIREIRKALDDAGGAFIRTAHRRGYAFSASAQVFESARDVAEDGALYWLAAADSRHRLAAGENVIGRAKGLALSIDHPSVSRLHARMIIHDGSATIEDLDSTNGTWVGGRKITSLTRVHHGDAIRLGQAMFTFEVRATAPSSGTERVSDGIASDAHRGGRRDS